MYLVYFARFAYWYIFHCNITYILCKYSSLLNNRAANLILFWKKSILHVLIPSYTFINFWIFLAKTFFYTNEKWKSPSYTALFHPTRLLIFGILPSYTFIPSYTIIKETRVLSKTQNLAFNFALHLDKLPKLGRCHGTCGTWTNTGPAQG